MARGHSRRWLSVLSRQPDVSLGPNGSAGPGPVTPSSSCVCQSRELSSTLASENLHILSWSLRASLRQPQAGPSGFSCMNQTAGRDPCLAGCRLSPTAVSRELCEPERLVPGRVLAVRSKTSFPAVRLPDALRRPVCGQLDARTRGFHLSSSLSPPPRTVSQPPLRLVSPRSARLTRRPLRGLSPPPRRPPAIPVS